MGTGVTSVDLRAVLETTQSFEELQKQCSSSTVSVPSYLKYILGVFRHFSAHPRGVDLLKKIDSSQDFCLFVSSEVPLGAAVSSSAALEVAVATLLRRMFLDQASALSDLD